MRLQELLSYVRRACDEYNMIDENDKITVGVSGGKDSLALLVALKAMQRFYPKRYELNAVTVSLGLPNFNTVPIQELCDIIGVDYFVVHTNIGKIIFDDRKENNPCSLCSKMRKGALNDEALRLGSNKIALGHNKDDVIETFFLSLFYEGRINTFSPTSYLDRKKLFLIRPLIYTPEKEVLSFVDTNGVVVVKSPCPVDGYTKREEMKKFIAENEQQFDNFSNKVFGAIQRAGLKSWGRE